jgi:hypothetical protein
MTDTVTKHANDLEQELADVDDDARAGCYGVDPRGQHLQVSVLPGGKGQ